MTGVQTCALPIYTKLTLDKRSLATTRTHLAGLDDPLARAVLWEALWDMVRDAELLVSDYLEITLANIDVETDSATLGTLTRRMTTAIESYSDPRTGPSQLAIVAKAASERQTRAAQIGRAHV